METKRKNQKQSHKSVSSRSVRTTLSFESLLFMSPMINTSTKHHVRTLLLLFLILIALLTFTIVYRFDYPCGQVVVSRGFSQNPVVVSRGFSENPVVVSSEFSENPVVVERGEGRNEGEDFWKQPDGMGYRPCLDFSLKYREETKQIQRDRKKYLIVLVSGGLNQQRNGIVDAVVIARILGAALVVPVLQVNQIWGDQSKFSDIFDFKHFRKALANDVQIVESLPSSHAEIRPLRERFPVHASAEWIRNRYLKRLNRIGVFRLGGLDSRLSRDLPPDLQKLRCKVAFQALKFSTPISVLGKKLVKRMRRKGPYLALHLRMEKDVWIRTGCHTGLSHEYDDIIHEERTHRPELLTGKSTLGHAERKLAGRCPLTAVEVSRLLKALGAPRNASIYWAGGEPFGGAAAMQPLVSEFPFFYNKENISLPGELEPYANRSSILAAIDYIVSLNSDVFMQSHGGNMGRALQGQRAFAGHKKHIVPNKPHMISYFLNTTLSESEFNRIVKNLHAGSIGQPDLRTDRINKDVTSHPIPECMCNSSRSSV